MSRLVVLLALVGACSSKSDDPPPPAPAPIIADAGVDGITTIGTFDPASGMHIDGVDVAGGRIGTPDRTKPRNGRTPRPIDIILRSSPSGARAAVDGVYIGNTPTYWFGESDGREHEFTFTLPRHAAARYRFIPFSNGVVHGTLDPVADETLPPDIEPQIAPVFAPDAAVPMLRPDARVVDPPPTVIVDAPTPNAPPPAVVPQVIDAPQALVPDDAAPGGRRLPF